jgi:hypothetical protein
MDFETIFGLVSFAALIIVWAFAPSKPATTTSEVPSAVPQKALAS